MNEREPLYTMAVAARLTGMHPQTLRKYERAGLLRPARDGSQRLYSDADIRRLRRIRYLVEERGLNVAGLEMMLSMTDRLDIVDAESSNDDLRTAITETLRLTDEWAGRSPTANQTDSTLKGGSSR
jgi:MerR family transcriptional regulator/heat shock protein HspR